MEEDNPIARHGKLQVTLVAAKLCFFRLSKERAHAWMRHVSLDRYARSRERFARGFGQLEGDMSHPGMSPRFAEAKETDPGRYEARLEFPMAGDWVILLHVTLSDGKKLERQFDVRDVRPN